MTNIARARIAALACSIVWISGCGGVEETLDASSVVEGRIEHDVRTLISDLEVAVTTAASLSAREDGEPACGVAVGACQVCWALDGDELEGTAVGTIDEVPCLAQEDHDDVAAEYRATSSRLDLAWSGDTPGDYQLTVSGDRDAAVYVGLLDSPDGAYTANWDVVEFAAAARDGAIVAASLELRYPDSGGWPWSVSVSADEEQLVGTATRDDGVLCALTGRLDAPRVACDLL